MNTFYSRGTLYCNEKQSDAVIILSTTTSNESDDDDMYMHGYQLWPSDEPQFHAKVVVLISRCGKEMHNMSKQRNKR